LAVDSDNGHIEQWVIKGVILLDIVPTVVQWESFGNSQNAAGTFHWPFLANSQLATTMIKQYGGASWCSEAILRWAGKTEQGLQSLKADGAIELYGAYFSQESVIRASCEDYRAGSAEDVDEQKQDQKLNKKLKIDTLVSYSSTYLGSRYDVHEVWKEWFTGPGSLRVEGIEGGIGHFIAEEAPKQISALISSFYTDLLK
jgi:hypothetical protein